MVDHASLPQQTRLATNKELFKVWQCLVWWVPLPIYIAETVAMSLYFLVCIQLDYLLCWCMHAWLWWTVEMTM